MKISKQLCTCPVCWGDGFRFTNRTPNNNEYATEVCKFCNGAGVVDRKYNYDNDM